MATNTESLFSEFEIEPLDGIKITGIHYLPSSTPKSPVYRPLIVFLHGATCTAHNFDISPDLTASSAASALSIPLISINRPGYLSSTQLPLPSDATYHETLGNFYHKHLFPLLWTEFGGPLRCTSLVLFAHSFGTPAAIVAAGLHARNSWSSQAYPLAGIIFSGWGILPVKDHIPTPTATSTPSEKAGWKRLIMFHRPEYDLVPPSAITCLAAQDQPIPPHETNDITTGAWWRYWREYTDAINVPVMFAQAEYDLFWEGSEAQVAEMRACFPHCPRFDGSLVKGAPHAIEWSWIAAGWYARTFGFAMEVTAVYAQEMKRKEHR